MKTFAELEKGDKIYYWDHGKLHEQIVSKIEKSEKVDEWKDWYGKTQKRTYDKWHIEAGRRSKLNFYYTADHTVFHCGGMVRFSCLDAARDWLENKQEEYNKRANKYKNRYDAARLCADRFERAYCSITRW